MRCVASENVTSSHRTRRPVTFSLGVTYQRMSEARELREDKRVFANDR